MKKRRLKKWVKYTLSALATIFVLIVLAMIFNQEMKSFNDIAQQCDKERGYACSYYEVRQYGLKQKKIYELVKNS
jgi:hypothetical protein